jgi:hypothetical protein
MTKAIVIVERLYADTMQWARLHHEQGHRIEVAGCNIRLKALIDVLTELYKEIQP